MARPPMPIGTYGNITTKQLAAGKWTAYARFRDFDGVTRQVEARGPTEAKAKTALKQSFIDRVRAHGDGEIRAESTVEQLMEAWLKDAKRSKRAPQTIRSYERTVNKIVLPGLRKVRLREATTGRLELFFKAIPTDSGWRDARTVLNMAFGYAARLDAVPNNPVRDTTKPPKAKTAPRALTPDELHELRGRVLEWQTGQKLGPKRAYDLAEIIDVMIGTGTRIGEALALRWQDVDGLDGDGPVVVTIAGTLVEIEGEGVIRQDWPKTEHGWRSVTVPKFTAAALRRHRDRGIPSAEDLVFPTRNGTPRWPANVRTHWRKIRGGDFGWVTPHSFRRTVGTIVEREIGLSAASVQLGHASTGITEKHYVERLKAAPDASNVLDLFAPRAG